MPDDVSAVGFDDIPEVAYLIPALTTVRQDFEELGCRCLVQLRALLEDEAPLVADASIRPELVVRRSTAAAAGWRAADDVAGDHRASHD